MKSTGLSLFIAWILCGFIACKEDSAQIRQRNEKIDSLAHVLAECEEALDIPKDDILAREKKIEASCGKINQYNKGEVSPEGSFMIDEYISLGKLYKRYLENRVMLEQELKDLKKQLYTLKKTNDSGKITDVDFKKYINTERQDVLKLHEMVEEFAEAVTRSEPLYVRISPRVEAFADSVYKHNGGPPLK